MTVEFIRIREGFFSLPAGSILRLIPDTLESEVCDVCGEKKRCDWYEPVERSTTTGMDVCRRCSKILDLDRTVLRRRSE